MKLKINYIIVDKMPTWLETSLNAATGLELETHQWVQSSDDLDSSQRKSIENMVGEAIYWCLT